MSDASAIKMTESCRGGREGGKPGEEREAKPGRRGRESEGDGGHGERATEVGMAFVPLS